MSFDRMILAELKTLILEKVDHLTDILSEGNAVDFPEYKFYAGQIRAYKTVSEDLFQEAVSKVEKRD